MQIVADDRLMVIDVYAGWPGSAHDARVFKNSSLYQAIKTGSVPLGENKFLIGKVSQMRA